MAFDFTDPRRFAPRAALYALAFEEAGSALAVQRQLVADVRSRAAGAVATAALVTSIVGSPPVIGVLPDQRLGIHGDLEMSQPEQPERRRASRTTGARSCG